MMTRFDLSLTSRKTVLLAALALGSVACGGTGSGDDDDAGAGATGGTGGTTGGTSATGGTSGGGSGGSAGMAAPTQEFRFTDDEQGWSVQYTSSGTLASGEAAEVIDKTEVGVSWSTGKGDGDMGGALQLEIPYESEAQYVGVGLHLNAEDMTGKLVRARVKLEEGLGDPVDLMSNPGGAKLYAKSGTEYVYAAGAFINIDTVGKWVTLTFDLANRSSWSYEDTAKGTFDPAEVGEIGIQFDTGGTTTTAMPAVELVDNVTW